MLKHLEISNYALIEQLSIDFGAGLSVVTGETGAGKSIMMGALALVLGQRADTKVIQEGKTKCVVEAIFNVRDYGMEALFETLEVDYEHECIVRREVLDSGKSRAFVNDTPVNLQQLREVTSRLIDIHSQHESLLLGEASFQLDVLDSVAKSEQELVAYQQLYKTYKQLQHNYKTLSETAEKWRSERDYAQFQYDQLVAMQLLEDEQEQLEQELEAMNHSEEVKTALALSLGHLEDDSSGVNLQLKDITSALCKIKTYVPAMADYEARVESALIELKDIASELQVSLNDTEFDPQRKEFVENRLNELYSLQQKHHVKTVIELLQLQADFGEKLQRIDSFDSELLELQKRLEEAEKTLQEAGAVLTKKRSAVKQEMEEIVSQKLGYLGMPNAQFIVDIATANHFLPTGYDVVNFLFSANKNATPQPIAQTASGGELSRLMLVIKSLIVSRTNLPTIIFDEIDTGVSGEIAHRMGEIMQLIAKTMQVITITHLPQIAAKGATHYKVYKYDTERTTITDIVQLNSEERIEQIAEMLSGKNPSVVAMDNARELLNTSV